ncbi:PQQ-dependent sugar dehydrogenase [Taklimakanibacter lacteus]|uniref:PQQ-dependent sugar dehydrogenase n=1 Tax=Taklimakanibacter lacteus TaxID=2268456 RepID=UPI000E66CE21
MRLVLVLSLALLGAIPAVAAENFDTEKGKIAVDTIADGLPHPWAIDFLPDGRMIVTERGGRMRIVTQAGSIGEAIQGVPKVDAGGQGGLLDVAVHPNFTENRLIYWSFSEAGQGGNSTAVARGRLGEDATTLNEVRVIFSQKPKLRSNMHFGSRLVFDGSGHLFVTLGERSAAKFRVQAQQLDSHLGKVVRLMEDGTVPGDNPFVNKPDALPEIWSYGHRNPQAAAINPATGELWEIEHGPRGGDEINIPQAGKNYGWPVISYGVNYNGTPVGSGRSEMPGMEQPIYQWTPVIAPSGMAFYTGALFPQWKNNLFVGGLRAEALVRLELDGNKVIHEERLLRELGLRIRDVAQSADGSLYVITDEDDGMILKLSPAKPGPS